MAKGPAEIAYVVFLASIQSVTNTFTVSGLCSSGPHSTSYYKVLWFPRFTHTSLCTESRLLAFCTRCHQTDVWTGIAIGSNALFASSSWLTRLMPYSLLSTYMMRSSSILVSRPVIYWFLWSQHVFHSKCGLSCKGDLGYVPPSLGLFVYRLSYQ